MLKYTFILTTITIVLAGTLLNAQDQPLRYDSDVLEMVKIVIKGMENPSSSKTAATSKELKPAHEVWQKWEKLKAAEDSPQSTVNADIPIAELKRLAEKGDKNALSILQTRLRQLVIDKDTEVIMLEALIKIGHTDAPRLLEERKKQQEDDKRKQKEKEEREQRDKERKAEAERKRAEAEQKRIEEKAAAEKLLAEEEANRKRLAEEEAKRKQEEQEQKENEQKRLAEEEHKPVNLEEWIKDNWWGDQWSHPRSLVAILTYGTKELQNDLAIATNDKNTADIKNAEENIKSLQKKIAAKKFYCDITNFRLLNQQSGSRQATVEILFLSDGILMWYSLYNLNKGVEWWFCLPNCKHNDTGRFGNVSISGGVNEIDKLVKNRAHYFLRVYLTGLKLDPNGINRAICKVDRYEIREAGDDDWKPKNYVAPYAQPNGENSTANAGRDALQMPLQGFNTQESQAIIAFGKKFGDYDFRQFLKTPLAPRRKSDRILRTFFCPHFLSTYQSPKQ